MWKKLKKFIKTRGLFETMIFAIWLAGVKIRSLVIIFFYRLRGYNINYDVLFYGKTFLQRSKKNTIRIQKGCSFEEHIKMRCYGEGTISIGKNVSINEYSMISAGDFVTIGNDVVIGAFCYINDTNHEFPSDGKLIREQGWKAKGITIEDNVWIGANVTILDNVTVGKNSVIGAGAVVTKDVAPGIVVAGVPAKQLHQTSYEKNRN